MARNSGPAQQDYGSGKVVLKNSRTSRGRGADREQYQTTDPRLAPAMEQSIGHHQRPASLENSLAYQIPIQPHELHFRELPTTTVRKSRNGLRNPNGNPEANVYTQPVQPGAADGEKQAFLPVNGTYKKVFPGLPQEITHENFGILAPVKGSLGARNIPTDYAA